MRQDTCKGCGEQIIWIKTLAGKAMPCDPKVKTIITSVGQMYRGYESHFATCPKADELRGGQDPG